MIYDAEHFFDAFKANREYALKTLLAAQEAGASVLVLCDTNGGTMPEQIAEAVAAVKSPPIWRAWGFIRITTRGLPSPMDWPRSARAHRTRRGRSTASASAAATWTCCR